MSQHFYDGQIKRYITQIVRLMSNFSYKDAKGNEVVVPVVYGDLTRQVASILRDNSENKIPSAPRMAVYITGIEMDRERTSDASFVSKVNVRERAFDTDGQEYLNTQGKNYTVERLMPAPYNLSVNVDIWTTNTDQKLQLLEQIFMLFRPSLEIQTTDNYIDWTSLTTVNLESIQFSSRSIPVGVDSDIDVAQLSFKTPIYISPPVKVKRLGVITNIITSIFDETRGTIDLGLSMPELNQYDDSIVAGRIDVNGTSILSSTAGNGSIVGTNYQGYDIYVNGDNLQIMSKGSIGTTSWRTILESHPGQYQPNISRIFLRKLDTDTEITGTIYMDIIDETQLSVTWDSDTFPSNSIIEGKTVINYIIDPSKNNPSSLKSVGTRILLLSNIGDASNTDGADAWKNNDNSDLIAMENDIVEWDGAKWNIVFQASSVTSITYVTNLNTGVQYRWDGEEWLLSVDGQYPQGSWRLALDG